MTVESIAHAPAAALVQLTDTQSGLWFTEQLADSGGAYQVGFVVDLHGDLDVAALDRAVSAVAERHPVLGSALSMVDGRPLLRLGSHRIGLDQAGGDTGEVLARPFPLDGTQPLARFVLQREAPRHHRLVIAAHHLVFDGESKDIVLRELALAYAGAPAAGTADYAAAVRSELDLAHRLDDTARGYWAGHWVTPTGPSLPLGGGSPVGGSVDVLITPATRDGFAAAARAAACTRFEFLLAAVHLLLHRYGNDTATVAVDVGTRDIASADVIGMFVNELPITSQGPVTGPFPGFVATLRARLREAYPLRAVPVARVAPVPAGTALSAVSLSYRRQRPVRVFAGLGTVIDWAPFTGTPRSPLHLQIVDLDDEIVIRLRHDGRQVSSGTAALIAQHLSHLLHQLVQDPQTSIQRLDVVTPAEAVTLRTHLTGPPAMPETTLTALLHNAAHSTGDIVCGEDRLTHREVHEAALSLAGHLAGLGIGPGQTVGLCAERGITALTGLLAIVHTGAAYLPLDPQYPAERLRFVLGDAAPALVLCSAAARDALPGGTAPVLVIGEPPTLVEPGELRPPEPGDPAYVIYTSGSTGQPKGVVVSHRAIANLLQAMAAELGSGPDDVWLWLTSLGFDISTVECFLPLLTGATMVIADDTQVRDGAALRRLVGDNGVTHVQATPSTWELILAAGPATLAGVTALSGGEPLVPALASRLLPEVARLINVYGPTETTVWSTLAGVTAHDAVTIGRPIAGTTAHVVDGNLAPVPAGITGRLCLAGVGVADYYHARASLTAQRFLPDPFGPPGSRLYLTGDNARVLDDGSLVCLGRDDLQVKVRGHRIELGEIEARLREHPAVTGAVVTVAGNRLVAFVTGAGASDEAVLRGHLAAYLPSHMIPGAFVWLDALPLTPNGKVDRGQLTAPPPPATPARPAVTGDAIHDAVTAIWCEALQVADVGPDDDLFDLGGHSLTITQIAARIRDRFDVDLPLHVLWDAPTITATAAALRAAVTR